MKIFIVNGNWQYIDLFCNEGWEVVSDLNKSDLVLFTGGEDVSPHLYGEQRHYKTFSSHERDTFEKNVFEECVKSKKGMVGICRGGQFLNVMNGGKMYQDVSNHCQNHIIKDKRDNSVILVSSTHHQMMRPTKEAEIIAVAFQKGYKEYCSGNNIVRQHMSEDDAEVVYYKGTNSLCFQPHPEFTGEGYNGMRKYFFNVLNSTVLKKV